MCEPLFHTYTKQDTKLQTEQLKFLDNMWRFLKEVKDSGLSGCQHSQKAITLLFLFVVV